MPEVIKESDLTFGFQRQRSRYKELGEAVMALKDGEILKCVAGIDFPAQEDRMSGSTKTHVVNVFRAAIYEHVRKMHGVSIRTSADFQNNCLYVMKRK